MAATIILKAIFRNKTAFKFCIKQCIVNKGPFLLYTLYLSFWFSILPHIITTKKKGDQNGHHNYNLKDCVL